MSSPSTRKHDPEYEKTYTSCAALHRLRGELCSPGENERFKEFSLLWKDDKHTSQEDRRLSARECDQERVKRYDRTGHTWELKALTLYSERLLFIERHGRPRPQSTRHQLARTPFECDVQKEVRMPIALDLVGKIELPVQDNTEIFGFIDQVLSLPPKASEETFKPGLNPISTSPHDVYTEDNHAESAATACDCFISPCECSLLPSNRDSLHNGVPYVQLPNIDWFRLLVLLPGSHSDELECKLVMVQRDTALRKYETLSYSWRNGASEYGSQRHGSITCNGYRTPVTDNLRIALHHIRRCNIPRILWIDALCINQSDPEERSKQVQIMDSIYAQSFRTLVWLGEGHTDTVHNAFDTICGLVNQWYDVPIANYQAAPSVGTEHSKQLPSMEFKAYDWEEWHAMSIMFSADWFERRWVIQEIVNSSNVEVIWGLCEIPWIWIGLGAAILRTQHQGRLREHSMRGVHKTYLMFRLWRKGPLPPIRPTFLQLLRLTEGFSCTEPLDQFYALLGIRTADNDPGTRPFIEVDYGVALDDVHIRIAEKLLQLDRPLSFLSQVIPNIRNPFRSFLGSITKRAADLHLPRPPTWIPKWGSSRSTPILTPWDLDERFQPGKGLPFKRHIDHNIPQSHLALDGIIFSTVMWIGELTSQWHQDAVQIGQLLSSGAFGDLSERTLDIISGTLRARRDAYGSLESVPNSHPSHFSALLVQSYPGISASFPDIQLLADKGKTSDFTEAANNVCPNRCIFLTTGGHFGLGPQLTDVGDVVCILGGADMPIVLRRGKLGPERPILQHLDEYGVIGECFIDRVMNGEVVEAANNGKTHSGPFDPRLLMEHIHDLNPLADVCREYYSSLKSEVLELARKRYGKLKVEVINIL
ncbi:heterokaryon incompatibility protein-domain-containing protein [Clohesyomyces aquaticus]|uniref:Heterokaryon incompatibility protein-domain-containing protein n=1 Tax=Clohesyomyces aquaticus TaxID=1231657 RepID=A0A1Y1YH16_9PLEO|nr:heterokaryon incompatibility protein-domain-containing protein [Clohesyomyces aquaticus]